MRTLFILLLLTAPLFAEDITIQVEQIEGRYNVKSGDFTYHFTDSNDLNKFANSVDSGDDQRTATVRQLVKQELDANAGNAIAMATSLEKEKTYSVVKQDVLFVDVTPTPVEEIA